MDASTPTIPQGPYVPPLTLKANNFDVESAVKLKE